MTAAQSLRIIRRLVIVDFTGALIYRAEFVMFMISTVLAPAISLLVWRAALANGAELPVDAQYLTTYFVLLGLVSMLTSSWTSGFLAEEIRLGRISKWLIRPGSTHFNGIANNISEKIIKSVALAPMIAILGWFFRDAIVLPTDPLRWTLFLASIVAAAVMVYALDVCVGSLAFWVDDTGGIDYALGLIAGILAGRLVPLALLPAWSQGIVDIQPFRFTLSFSLELVVGDLSTRDLAIGMALQLIYPVLAVLAARAIWRRGLQAYTAVGA
ncbi:MAG TPA: ABC-2 family transporter protein [Thermomicrobiales bacterium]|nr:ABC-2 family transporter protein [Thermomicrobiales bacterium]